MLKKQIKLIANRFGYEIRKPIRKIAKVSDEIATIPDLELYKKFYPVTSLNKKKFYNIGAGGFGHPFWTNVDYDSEWYSRNREQTLKGLQYDLLSLDPLPIDDNSAEVVYSSHTIEHINDPAAQHLFNEAHRILKVSGYLRIATPNIDLCYRAYKENDRSYFYWIADFDSTSETWKQCKYNMPLDKATTAQVFLSYFAGSVSTLHSDGAPERVNDSELEALFRDMEYEKALDYCTSKCPIDIQKKYPGNHINWFNFKKVSSMLKNSGFTQIYLSAYGQSFCPILRNIQLFDNTHPKIALYVEASK